MKITFSIIFIDDDSTGETCSGCGQLIKGKKWVMLLDFGDPVNFPPYPLDKIFCTLCKLEIEKPP